MIVEQEYRTIQLRQLDVLFGLIICMSFFLFTQGNSHGYSNSPTHGGRVSLIRAASCRALRRGVVQL
jgi:hypothetical protein